MWVGTDLKLCWGHLMSSLFTKKIELAANRCPPSGGWPPLLVFFEPRHTVPPESFLLARSAGFSASILWSSLGSLNLLQTAWPQGGLKTFWLVLESSPLCLCPAPIQLWVPRWQFFHRAGIQNDWGDFRLIHGGWCSGQTLESIPMEGLGRIWPQILASPPEAAALSWRWKSNPSLTGALNIPSEPGQLHSQNCGAEKQLLED